MDRLPMFDDLVRRRCAGGRAQKVAVCLLTTQAIHEQYVQRLRAALSDTLGEVRCWDDLDAAGEEFRRRMADALTVSESPGLDWRKLS